jgi:hypothetical protein
LRLAAPQNMRLKLMRRFLIILCGFLAVALCLGWLLWSQAGSRDYTMPDGSIISVEKVGYGEQEHIYLSGTLDRLKAALPPSWQEMFPALKLPAIGRSWHINAVTRTNEDALYIYISRRKPGQGYCAVGTDQFAQLVDEDGCAFVSAVSGGYDDGPFATTTMPTGIPGMGTRVAWFRFEAFPRRDRKFRFLVSDFPQDRTPTSGPLNHAEFTVANPAPRPRIANWPVEPLPITRTQDRVSFILTNVTIKTNDFGNMRHNLKSKAIQADYAFAEDGQPSTNWEALETDLYDSSSNFISGKSPYAGALCPRESAWKLRVKFFGGQQSRAGSNAVWTLRGVAVPGPGQFTLLDRSEKLQGVPVKAVTFGGAGNFTYSNNIALDGTPAVEPITNNYSAMISMPANWSGKHSIPQPAYSLHVNRPHLAVDIGDLSGDQRFTVRAVDDQGREFYGYKLRWRLPSAAKHDSVNFLDNWYDHEGNFLAFDLPADAKTVDLTFCVHTCRTAEFIFKPPAAERTPVK